MRIVEISEKGASVFLKKTFVRTVIVLIDKICHELRLFSGIYSLVIPYYC
ncbi:hypothetical protein GCM10017161_39170 [Thalassotalea marina]|uniref:Uncharacterized protein n=1 Tax=Thalassotalea marina TaxID=1673741 RepID=A0A919EPT5_9GAMM|nr:hypothetical protein GCM10017161_39170 [Thalassotalea marina]